MDNERQNLLYALSGLLMANERKEAEAVEGYNQQLKIIEQLRNASSEEDGLNDFLDKLETATIEKISDELNHGQSLYEEYVELTGIKPAKE